ncbi:helix-turn-helix transcriptional regulator [Rhodococcus sp. G-MC3]|uniref:helix-turn-helix transcriptional regulator n=1 Tax=Rhodococcus sp. G-MC3 TaxID=3046209 RepID=UPI0024B9CCA4|nr:helix-turn-helix transcriptional regulator [Rhodococcus sp. G-MC3]MDJ0396007.1 helix-turn-helix transcriptional regulator [Rhodococcus sp. G-MC3]
MDRHDFGDFVRARREALQPEDLGLRRGSRRRTHGLRREEVADLADMSADYLARLERGAGPLASEQVVKALARALRLTVEERDHLFVLAGHRVPAPTETPDHVSPGIMRIIDRLVDTPAQVMGALGETLAQNPCAVALLGDETHYEGQDRSAIFRWFTDLESRKIYPGEHHHHHSRVLVSQLRSAAARQGKGSPAAGLVEHLHGVSPEFETVWDAAEIGVRFTEEKLILHPEVGEMSLFCQMVVDPDQMQTLLVFTATPGSESAEKLRLLTVVGVFEI